MTEEEKKYREELENGEDTIETNDENFTGNNNVLQSLAD